MICNWSSQPLRTQLEQVHRILEWLDSEGIIDGSVADKTFSSSSMISRYRFEHGQQIQDIVGH